MLLDWEDTVPAATSKSYQGRMNNCVDRFLEGIPEKDMLCDSKERQVWHTALRLLATCLKEWWSTWCAGNLATIFKPSVDTYRMADVMASRAGFLREATEEGGTVDALPLLWRVGGIRRDCFHSMCGAAPNSPRGGVTWCGAMWCGAMWCGAMYGATRGATCGWETPIGSTGCCGIAGCT